ncbi:chaperone modulatory protein CbpM [Bradyrhizobium elkanii]|jgi:chaperone modulatory protein CbpM|nr:chaperone modulatory protein CbpM [Bradyrhizobium elkanii]MCS4067863.1 chaperone modulatory protein CbpM [Bradyrhizobium elkanii]MCS4083399.1 chaperone modulatory protein CbpM [Bradyrhizobium elkanii]MCW2126974.1 chaperone modulatory protein CbpM [Bradyrhizobium elkanii]MCW2173721.1 chaperone modulatory protein CbpM [Bradyrhizobium elkanii]
MTLNKQEFLTSAGLRVRTLELWLEQRWLVPTESASGALFSDGDVARARLIQDLKGDFGVNDEGIDVILHLIDQLHGVRQAFALLRATFNDMSGNV